MANIKNFGLVGVGSDVQFGKSGPRLINSSGVFAFRNAANAADADITAANLTLSGNLTVIGGTTTVESTTLTVADKNIELAKGSTTDAAADQGGLTLHGTTDKTLVWDAATNTWLANTNMGVVAGQTFKIGGTDVLSATTLGSGVVNSGLTSVGTLVNLHVSGTSLLDGAVTAGDALTVAKATTLNGGLAIGAGKTVDFGSTVLNNVGTGVASTDGVNVGQLTAAIAAVNGTGSALQTEVDAIETAVGLSTSGAFVPFTGTTSLNGATSIVSALTLLDTAGKATSDALAQEVSDRTTAVSDEASARDAAIAQEVSDRDAAIAVETTRAEAAELVLTNGLSAEVTARTNADTTLTTNLGNEVTRAQAAELVLTNGLAAEVTARTNADSAIQAELDAAELAIGLNADGTLAAFQTGGAVAGKTSYLAAVNALDSAVSALNTGSSAAVAAETTRAEGIENAIIASVGLNSNGSLKAFTGTATTGSTTVEGAITALDTALDAANAATAAEATRAEAAELVLTNGLAAEVTARTNADTTLTNNLAAEVTRAGNAELALGTRIDNLTTDEVAQGTTNLYFSNSLARSALSIDTTTGHTGLLYNSTTGVFGVDQTVIATVASVTAGDAATLAAAEAYTDSKVAGKTQFAGQAAYAAFAYTDTALTLAPAVTGLVHRVKVYVSTAFTDAAASIQVGTAGTANQFVSTADLDVTGAACYVVEIASPVAAQDLLVAISGATSTQGAGYVVIEWI
jgi:trimeric autotransporter adhesin